MVGGKETREQIGKLKVIEVQGENVCLCKVLSSGYINSQITKSHSVTLSLCCLRLTGKIPLG